MSIYGINLPDPDEISYHEARQVQRVEAARKRLTVSDVLSVLDRQIAGQADETAHPCYHLVAWLLEREPRVDGSQFWRRWQQLAEMAIDTALDDLLEMED